MTNELTVVMPVYNEEACIEAVVRSWLDQLSRIGMPFSLLLLDDGSRDRTAARLDALSGDARVRVVHKRNEGHGPTILQGYRLACAGSEWVFQVDSDDEIRADAFPALWARRMDQDFVLGVRQGRIQTPGRRWLSRGSRLLVRLLCGRGGLDVNVPFRLMRSDRLEPLLDRLPADCFAPNVALTGLAARRGFRIATVAVPHLDRLTGRSSLLSWRVLGIALRSLAQVGGVLLADRRKV